MPDVTLVLIRIFLEILRFRSVAQFFTDRTDLVEPLALVVAVIVSLEVLSQYLGSILVAYFGRYAVFDDEVIVEEVADELEYLFCTDEVFSRLLAVAAQIEYLLYIFLMTFQERQDLRSEFLSPSDEEGAEILCRDLHEHVL